MAAIRVSPTAVRSIRVMIPSLAWTGAKRRGFGVWLLVILACMFNGLSAATFGLFTYTDNGTFITITDYPTSATGAVEIPTMINGKPVTSIGNSAFSRLETRQAGMNIFVAVWGEPVCFAKRIGDDRSV
jgi:hypothetical protein